MHRRVFLIIPLLGLVTLCLTWPWVPSAAAQACGGQGVAVQVLGSGGPELEDKRASSSYLVWQDGQARALVDAGGGSALRFGESGARMSQLDVILFTHFHVDHSADFPALIFSSWFEGRDRPLPVYDPVGNSEFPSTVGFVRSFFQYRARPSCLAATRMARVPTWCTSYRKVAVPPCFDRPFELSFFIKSFSSAVGAGFLHLVRSATGPFCRQFVGTSACLPTAGKPFHLPERIPWPPFPGRCSPFPS
jgi:hypothetical protein